MRASVAIAGVEKSPDGEVLLPLEGTFVWSLRAKEAGHYSGRMILEGVSSGKTHVYVASTPELSISFDAAGTILFDTKTVLTLLGAFLLALIGSLPNWIKLFQRDRGGAK